MTGRGPARDAPSGAPLGLLVFSLDGRRCGLPLTDVVEVHRMVAVAALPGAPDIVEGLVDQRGRLVPVVDVRARLGLHPRPADPGDHLVIARAGTRTVALRVDAGLALVEVPADAVDRAVTALPGVVHVDGVTHDGEGLILVHDLATFLSLDEEQRLDAALAGPAAS